MVLGTDPPHTPKPPPGPGSAAAAPEPLTGTAAAARCWGLEAAAPRPGAETLGPRSGRLQAAGQEQSCSQQGSAARPAGSWAPGHWAPVLPCPWGQCPQPRAAASPGCCWVASPSQSLATAGRWRESVPGPPGPAGSRAVLRWLQVAADPGSGRERSWSVSLLPGGCDTEGGDGGTVSVRR